MTSDNICGVNAECICGGEYNVTCYGTPPAPGVLEAEVTGLAHGLVMGRVTKVVGNGEGHAVGDSLDFYIAYSNPVAVGDTILAPLGTVYSPFGICPIGDAGPDPLAAVVLTSDGNYQCTAPATPRPPALSESQFIAAVQSSNCVATLEAMSPAWSQLDCAELDGGTGVSGATGTGMAKACEVGVGHEHAGASAFTLSPLFLGLAFLGGKARRRRPE